jgi:opacity protein-like surface antigen
MEPSAQFEYSIISEEQKYRSAALFNKRGMVNNYSRINFYIFAGVGGVMAHVTPLKDLENHRDFDPAKLSTAGLAIPVGGGLKYVLSSDLSIGFEFGGRYTTNKYLDGLHTRTAKAPDMYYFALFNLVYRVKTSRTGAPILFKKTVSGMF